MLTTACSRFRSGGLWRYEVFVSCSVLANKEFQQPKCITYYCMPLYLDSEHLFHVFGRRKNISTGDEYDRYSHVTSYGHGLFHINKQCIGIYDEAFIFCCKLVHISFIMTLSLSLKCQFKTAHTNVNPKSPLSRHYTPSVHLYVKF